MTEGDEGLVRTDNWMTDVLATAEQICLPDWWIGGGFLRVDEDETMQRIMASWLTLFVDVPERQQIEEERFWVDLLSAKLSKRRGPREQFVTLIPESGSPQVRIQTVLEPAAHFHLDVHFVDRNAAVQRALDCDATPSRGSHPNLGLKSPGGIGFCIVRPQDGSDACELPSFHTLASVSILVPEALVGTEFGVLEGAHWLADKR